MGAADSRAGGCTGLSLLPYIHEGRTHRKSGCLEENQMNFLKILVFTLDSSQSLRYDRLRLHFFQMSIFQSNTGQNGLNHLVSNKGKGRILKRVFQENKARQIFLKRNISYPLDTHTYVCVSLGKKSSIFEKFGAPCLFETPILRFALLPYYRRFN